MSCRFLLTEEIVPKLRITFAIRKGRRTDVRSRRLPVKNSYRSARLSPSTDMGLLGWTGMGKACIDNRSILRCGRKLPKPSSCVEERLAHREAWPHEVFVSARTILSSDSDAMSSDGIAFNRPVVNPSMHSALGVAETSSCACRSRGTTNSWASAASAEFVTARTTLIAGVTRRSTPIRSSDSSTAWEKS
jgi:hypothetical protein